MTIHSITEEHRALAEKFHANRFDELRRERDAAVFRLYFEYGLVETQRLTGWCRPTILKSVQDHQAASTKKRKRS